MEQVVWKDVVGFEGRYQVSNMGQVRSLDICLPCKNGGVSVHKGKIKPLHKNNRGYVTVGLCKERKTHRKLLHRLVAEAFVDKSEEKTQVNHIDGDISNNRASNLEWVTDNENKIHSSISNGGTQRPKRPVIVRIITENSNATRRFGGLREAERALGLDHKSALNVLKGKQKQTKGYVLCYEEVGGTNAHINN